MPTPTRDGRQRTSVAPAALDTSASCRRALTSFRTVRRTLRSAAAFSAFALLAAALPSRAAAQVDLVLNVTDTPDPVPATGVVLYNVTLSNNGVTTATGVSYTMNVPASQRYQGVSVVSGVACTGMSPGQVGPGVLTCTHPNIAFAASGSFTVFLQLNTQGTVSVTQSVSSTQPDADPANNTVTNATTVGAGADVGIQLTGASTAVSGAPYTYTLGLTNNGPSAATLQRVQWTLPTGFTRTGALPSTCTQSVNTITCNIAGPIANGGSLAIGTVTGVITAGSPSTVSTVATVALQSGAPGQTPRDPNTGNNASPVNITVTAGSDLRITKTRSVAGPYFTGNTFSFTLTPVYFGDVPNTITVTDVVPSNYTIGTVAISQNGWTCGVLGQTVTCTRPTGGVAGSNQALGTISIPVTVNAPGASVTNTASISAAGPVDPVPGNNSGSDGGTALLTPSADISVAKAGPSPALAVIGVPFDWRLTTSNGGPSVFSGQFVMTDSLPAGVSVTAIAPNGWSCTPATLPIVGPALITCTRTYTAGAPLASGASAPTVTLTAVSSTSGPIRNAVGSSTVNPNVPDLNPGNGGSSNTVTSSNGPASSDLRVVKTVDLSTVPAGDVLTYTLELVNAGPDTSRTITITDDLQSLINNGAGPTGQGFVSATVVSSGNAIGTIACVSATSGATGRAVTCTVPTLPVCTQSVDCPRIAIAIRPGGNGGSRSNTATAISSVTADANLINNNGTVTSTVDARADVTITKFGSPSPVSAGQDLTYTLTAPNSGPSAAANVTVTDVLPLNVVFVSATPSAGSCSVTPTAGTVTTTTSRTVTCNLGTVNNGAQRTLSIVVRPTTPTRGTTLVNNASVSTTTVEPPVNNTNTTTLNTPVNDPSLDLIINKTESVDPLPLGSNTVYTVTVTNDGPSSAENVVVTDSLPSAGLSFQSYTAPGATCGTVPSVNSLGGVLQCTFARIDASATASLTVTMRGVAKGVYTNVASVASDESVAGFDYNADNNRTEERTTVRTITDMQLVSKIASVTTIAVRRPYSWTIRVRNNVGAGLTEADNVVVKDSLPNFMELTGTPTVAVVSGSVTGTTCTGALSDVSFSCVLGTFSNGGIVDITVPVRNIDVPAGGVATNQARVTTASFDQVPANDTLSGSTTITGASISGVVFRDFANDGAISGGDTGMNGVGLVVSGTTFDAVSFSRSVTTDSTGAFSARGLPEGTYQIVRGTVSEGYLVVGTQTAGSAGGDATVVPNVTGIALGENVAATDYRFAFIPQARIGLAKSVVGTPVANTDGSLSAVLRIAVRNYSLETLNAVSVTDQLSGVAPLFGTYVAGGSGATLAASNYTISATPSINGTCTGGTVNAAFDGTSDTQVATITSLAVSTTCTFDFTLRYRPSVPLPAGNYSNQAAGAGTGALSNQSVGDNSQNGTNPDPDSDGNPGNNNARTPLNAVLAADVTTVVTLDAGPIAAGATVNGTISYSNTGPYTAQSVGYTMTMTTGLTNVVFSNLPTGATAAYNATTGVVSFTGMPTTLTVGQIASGDGTSPITVSFSQSGTGSTTVNTGISTTTNEGQNTAPNSGSANVTGPLVVDVTTALSFPTTVNAGQSVSGTIQFRNAGPSTASGVGYTLTLSTGLTGITFGNLPTGAGTSYNSTTGVVTLSGMPATINAGQQISGNGSSPITLAYTQPPSGNSNVASGITTTTGQGTNTLTDTASAPIGGVPIADVTTSLAFPVSVNAGQSVSGTVTFRNDGPSTAAGVTYSLTLTPNLTGVTLGNLPSGVTTAYVAATGVVTFTGMPTSVTSGTLVSGDGTSPITLSYTQPGTAVSTINSTIGTSTNQGANVGLDAAFASPGGGLIADVRALITAPTSVNAGGAVSTTVAFSNNGPSIASGMTYSLTMTAGLTDVVFGNLPSGATASYNSATGVVTFTGMPATLASGAIASGNGTSGITVSYTQNPVASSTLTANIGTSTSQGANIAPDTDTKTITGALIADVTTALASFPALVPPGAPVSGVLTYRNAGPSAAAGVTYGLSLAGSLTNVTFGNLPSGASGAYNSTTGVVTFSGMPASVAPATIVSGNGTSGITVAYTQSNALVTAIVSRIATITSQGTNALIDSAAVSISGLQGTDLLVIKTAGVTEVTPVDTITYTLRARNAGPVALPVGSILTDVPVAGITLTSVQCSTLAGNTCSTAPTTAALLSGVSMPALAVGSNYELLVRARVTAPNGGTITNRGQISFPVGFFDTDSTNNLSTVGPLPVRSRPDVAVTKTVDLDTLRVGGIANYIATVTNRGTAITAGTITFTETLPAGLTPNRASSPDFTCTVAGQAVTCTRTTPMTLTDTSRITIVTTVAPTVTVTSFSTTACQNTPDDNNATNDCATVVRPVAGRREATFRKEATAQEFIVGEPATFRLWVKNAGTVPLTGPLTIADTLPRGLTFASATGAGWSCSNASGVIGCTLPSPIAVGDSSAVTVVTNVGHDAVPAVTNCANLSVAGGAVQTNNGRSCVTVQTRGDYRLVLELSTPRYDRELSDVPDFTVIVRNVGRSPLPDVLLTNLLPRGFSYVAGTSVRGGAPDPQSRTRIPDPTSATNNSITWPLGTMAAGSAVRIDYRALIGIGATFNTDNFTISNAFSPVPGLRVTSNTARVPIRLRRGLFDNRGTIAGKVYVDCNCDRAAGQGAGEVGIPGVRVFMEDGTGAITDVEGKYNFINVRAGLHVVKVDRSTLPVGAQLMAINNRNAGDGGSRFVDLKAGELHRADFADGSASEAVLNEVLARRRAGEVNTAGTVDRFMAMAGQQMQGTTATAAPGAQPMVQAPVLGADAKGAQANGTPATSGKLLYVPLAPANALHDGNSNLPTTPMRANAALTGTSNPTGRQRVIVTLATDAVPANGRDMLPVLVRVLDGLGQPVKGNVPVTLETSAGSWQTVDADGTAKGIQVVVTDGVGRFTLIAPNTPVIADVRATSPIASATEQIAFTPESRAFTAIGVLQGRIDLRSLSRGSLDLTNAADGFEDALNDGSITGDSGKVRAGARGAVFLKGNVKGAGLLTLAFDSERDRDRTQFRDITPDQGWAVFGDGSLREFDAQSQQRLYARLDRGTSYVRYGDFATMRADDRRLLLAYDRSMTGLTYHGEKARGLVNTFVSRNSIRQVVDELQGRGLSGPYYLSRPNSVVNSERVEIVTRDRNQPSVILSTKPMMRFEEYTIEPLSGRVLFRAPVASMDANLNPVTIRVSYEVDQGGSQFMTYGGDGRLKVSERVELGAFAVRDENPIESQTMLGASASAKLGENTGAIAEIARTENGVTDQNGAAWRVELRHQSARMEGRAFALRSDSSFANRSSTFAGGRREFGLRWNASLNDRTRLLAEALRTEDERTDGKRSGASLGIERRLSSNVVAEIGFRWAKENGAPVNPILGGGLGSTLTGGQGGLSGITPLSFSAARARISSKIPGSKKSTLFGEYEYGESARRGSIGGEYLAFDRARLYLRHEWLTSQQGTYALNEDRSQQQTVFGIDADYLRNGQAFSEYRARDAFSGRDAEASIGLRNRFAIRKGLLANTSFERVTPLIGAASGTAFAATGAIEWTKASLWKSTARLEYRNSPTGDNVLASLGYARKLSRDWSLLSRSLWDQVMSNATRGRSQIGLAWRQTDRNRVNALFRIENRLDRSNAQGLPTSRTISNVAAAIMNIQSTPRLTFSTRYAAKLASDRYESVNTKSSAHLLMGRTIYDVNKRVDLGIIGSVLGNGGFGSRRYGAGGELGLIVMRNLRLAGGYNVFGFTDRDFASLGYTQRGAYLEFGFKFDESLFKSTGSSTAQATGAAR
jgi:uncharacterized repeat protein (TIGR01451 family)